jgi:hypothetical protein
MFEQKKKKEGLSKGGGIGSLAGLLLSAPGEGPGGALMGYGVGRSIEHGRGDGLDKLDKLHLGGLGAALAGAAGWGASSIGNRNGVALAKILRTSPELLRKIFKGTAWAGATGATAGALGGLGSDAYHEFKD